VVLLALMANKSVLPAFGYIFIGLYCRSCAKNVQVLEKVIDRRLPSSLASLYGAHLTCRLALAHAHLLVTIADTIPLLPNYTNLPALVARLCNTFFLFIPPANL